MHPIPRRLARLLYALAAGAVLATLGACATGPGGGTEAPAFRVDANWPKPLPNRWILGQVSGIATDSADHVWILQRPGSLTEDERGAALIETAFALPALIVMVWAVVQLGLVFRAMSGIQHALGEGARLAQLQQGEKLKLPDHYRHMQAHEPVGHQQAVSDHTNARNTREPCGISENPCRRKRVPRGLPATEPGYLAAEIRRLRRFRHLPQLGAQRQLCALRRGLGRLGSARRDEGRRNHGSGAPASSRRRSRTAGKRTRNRGRSAHG